MPGQRRTVDSRVQVAVARAGEEGVGSRQSQASECSTRAGATGEAESEEL